MGRWLGRVALGLGVSALGAAQALAALAVVSMIHAGTFDGRLQVEVRASEPLNYLVVEGADPFSVSLLFLNAAFAFAPQELSLPGPGLTRIRTSILEREGSRLGRLDLTFGASAPYRILKEGRRLMIRADAPPPTRGVVLPEPGTEPLAGRGPAPAPPREAALPAAPSILNLIPEIAGEDVRIIVEADAPLAWKSFVLEKPFRVVVDFERARLSLQQETIEVGDAVLRRIRSSQFTPTSVRVVLDLARPRPFRIEARPRGVVIHLTDARRP